MYKSATVGVSWPLIPTLPLSPCSPTAAKTKEHGRMWVVDSSRSQQIDNPPADHTVYIARSGPFNSISYNVKVRLRVYEILTERPNE